MAFSQVVGAFTRQHSGCAWSTLNKVLTPEADWEAEVGDVTFQPIRAALVA